MKKSFIIATIIIFAGVIGVVALTQQRTEETSPAPVAATIFPIYDIANEITDGAINVQIIVPAGASTHTFDPTPSTIRNLQEVEVVYAVGHGADDWVDNIVSSIDAEKMTLDNGIDIRETGEGGEHEEHDEEHEDEDEEDEHGHEHGETDPHYWLSTSNAITIAQTIEQDLSARFPEHADTFSENLNQYVQELETADTEIRNKLMSVENKNLITLHDAWYYFAQEYGLNIVGTFEPTAGREPTPQYLVELQEAIEASGSTTLYSEPQLAKTGLESFAQDNDLNIVELDPIGGMEGRDSYIALMKYNAETIAQNQ